MDKGTSLILIAQQNCPAALVSATHIASDFLYSAIVRNVSDSVLIGFRLGSVLRIRSQKTEVQLGERVNLPEGIKPNETCTVPPQAVTLDKPRKVEALVGFFIAEVFLRGEKPWEADLNEIEAAASGVH